MSTAPGISAYRSIGSGSGVEAASPERLVQMLLDGALERIATAKGHIQRNESARKGEQIGKAISIVEGLRGSLNPEAGALSSNLGDLYEYINARLLRANLDDDPVLLDEAAGLLREIKSAWDVLAVPAAGGSGSLAPAPA